LTLSECPKCVRARFQWDEPMVLAEHTPHPHARQSPKHGERQAARAELHAEAENQARVNEEIERGRSIPRLDPGCRSL
jgi:hypothetical protein